MMLLIHDHCERPHNNTKPSNRHSGPAAAAVRNRLHMYMYTEYALHGFGQVQPENTGQDEHIEDWRGVSHARFHSKRQKVKVDK